MPPRPPTLQGPPAALRWVLAQGVAAEIQVTGPSMEPTLPRGMRVRVSPVDEHTELRVGDVVVIATGDPDVLIVHRLVHAFVEGHSRLFIHQGDATGAAFGVVPREHVVARVAGVHADAPRLLRRRLVCQAYALVRRVATVAGLGHSPILRRCGQLFRRLASRVIG